jgi:hypothetical protein
MVILIAVIVIICITKIYNNNRILNLCWDIKLIICPPK